MTHTAQKHQTSALEPLKVSVFRAIWLSALCTNTGLFVQDVGAAWLMTSLTDEPFMIALMQTAQTLPFFLLALPLGALADLIDRRKLVLACQCWALLAAATLAFLTLNGLVTPWVLLTLTFLLFIANASSAPAWSAITPEIVPRRHLESAIGLGSAGYNLARGFGAAIGGLIVARFGVGWAFATNSCGYLVMISTLLRWKYKRDAAPEQNPEQFGSAVRAGLAYVKQSRALKAILVRTIMFATACSALWSLLPLLCRQQLNADSVQYGIIVSGFGIGTFLGAIVQPLLRRKLTLDNMSASGVVLFAASMAIVACSHSFMLTLLGMLGCGVAWTIKNSSLNVAVQMAAPNWVRARAYSVYLLVFQGCSALGAIIWGCIATWRSIPDAMLVASVMLLLGLIASIWHKLSHAEEMEMEVQNTTRPLPADIPIEASETASVRK